MNRYQMKRKFFSSGFFMVLTLSLLACGQRKPSALSADDSASVAGEYDGFEKGAILEFDTLEHAFGDVRSGEEVACRFGFTNTGTAPLLIQNVKAGCGCTSVEYPQRPVKPGERGAVEVAFNTRGKNGIQHQNVIVLSNGEENAVLLTITAQVR